MSFKDEYAKFDKPSPEREAFVLKSVMNLPKEQILNSMKTITVNGPNGSKISYKVMPDYIKVDGVRVPMSGATAQKVADHFGLNLPTPKQVQEIYQNADVQVSAQPLSGSGVNVGGKQYSGKDVVNTGVGYSPFALAYNDKVNKQLEEKGYSGDGIVAGFAKDIVPPVNGKLGLYGLFDSKGKPIQGGNGETPHDTSLHTEYGTYVRLVSPKVTITYPDGRTEIKPASEAYQGAVARYTPAPSTGKSKPESGPNPTGLDKIDQYLGQLSNQIASRMPIYDMLLRYGDAGFEIIGNLGKDPVIKDLTPNSIPGHPPEGFVPLKSGENNSAIGAAAKYILENYKLGDQITFKVKDQLYCGRSEPHYHPSPPKGESPAKYPKPWGWHRGVTVFKAKAQTTKPEDKAPEGKTSFLDRVDEFLGDLDKEI
jgi:hypothetical protein